MTELELRIQNIITKRKAIQKFFQEKLMSGKPEIKMPKVDDIFLSDLFDYLDNQIQSSELNVEIVAEAMGMSKSTLNRKIKALLDTTTNEIIKQYRLQKSLKLIAAGHSVSEAAFRVGFESPSYFTVCFKERYNQNPSEFQKMAG